MEEMSSIVRQNSESATSADHLSEQAASKAVVAQEVRKLSVRTTDSSQQIRALIEDITQRISEGSAQAIRSGDGIEEALDCLVLKNKIRSGKCSKKSKTISDRGRGHHGHVSLGYRHGSPCVLASLSIRFSGLARSFRVDLSAK